MAESAVALHLLGAHSTKAGMLAAALRAEGIDDPMLDAVCREIETSPVGSIETRAFAVHRSGVGFLRAANVTVQKPRPLTVTVRGYAVNVTVAFTPPYHKHCWDLGKDCGFHGKGIVPKWSCKNLGEECSTEEAALDDAESRLLLTRLQTLAATRLLELGGAVHLATARDEL